MTRATMTPEQLRAMQEAASREQAERERKDRANTRAIDAGEVMATAAALRDAAGVRELHPAEFADAAARIVAAHIVAAALDGVAYEVGECSASLRDISNDTEKLVGRLP